MAYALGTLKSPAPQDTRVAQMMQEYLLSFIQTGNPDTRGQPHWPAFTQDSKAPLVIGTTTRSVPGFRSRQLSSWYQRWERETGEKFPY